MFPGSVRGRFLGEKRTLKAFKLHGLSYGSKAHETHRLKIESGSGQYSGPDYHYRRPHRADAGFISEIGEGAELQYRAVTGLEFGGAGDRGGRRGRAHAHQPAHERPGDRWMAIRRRRKYLLDPTRGA